VHIYTVETTLIKEHRRRVSLRDDKGRNVVLNLHRFSLVGPGNKVVVDPNNPGSVSVLSREDPRDLIQVTPHFELRRQVRVGDMELSIRMSEITTQQELAALQYLQQFHYRTADINDEADKPAIVDVGGRKAILLAEVRLPRRWEAIGYIELHMPLMMAKPRHDTFQTPFKHERRPIEWSRWDQHSIKRFVNAIVRIARVVVSPEHRGLGLSRLLIEASQQFSRERWHIGGLRPLFMEISAEMLNYIDFVSSSGFVYLGKTEGNIERVVADLVSMRRGYEVSSGIMSLQKRYFRTLQAFCDETRQTFDDVVRRLSEIVSAPDPVALLSPEEWLTFRQVIRFPIPYYLAPLDDDAERYLTLAVKDATETQAKKKFKVKSLNLDLRSVRIASHYRIPASRNVRRIMEAFGIKGDILKHTIVGPIDIKGSSGNVVFVAGSSGSGKSVLLRALDPAMVGISEFLEISGAGMRTYTVAWLRPIPEDVPIFEYFADRYSVARAFSALSQVGLSDAFALIRPFALLSKGQRYRAMLADMLLRDDQVWLLDEFCADLDPFTARTVAHNFRRHVIGSGRIAFVAAANHTHFLDALKPSRVITLRPGAPPRVLPYVDYRNELLVQAN
jgi:ABC-type transport system involved in cytochrome c biogenesis ATPase subunit/GNAT superfamily N-acetyltransferase